ncbi:hypothetical protein K883_01366 [Mycobacterium sp. TKK-01-0059]|uniref:hypothetical protein n=1 Tax=Mycobacterium sp. TKK-01-0059 TaxID=1324269 RepID=UPI0004DAB413|nr:hypothetical protein [Mycobacterium sp. TKK-01-0059]KEF98363.1 hypothetical protein K883_01366 [Mycobacterium sp. TKK-01-0059]
MTDTASAEHRPESPLGRYAAIKYTYGQDETGNMTILEEQVVSTMPRPGKPKHKDFWESRKNLDYVRRFMNSHGASEWAGLGSMLEVVAQTIPSDVVLPDHTGDFGSLNAIAGLGGRSGGGKSTAMKLGRRVLHVANFELNPLKIGTGEGIPRLYGDYMGKDEGVVYTRDAAMLTAPDVATLYAQMKRSGATLLGELLSAWDGDNVGHSVAAKDRRVFLGQHRYRWALVMGIQFLESQQLLDTEGAGLMQRILLWPTTFTDPIDRSQPRAEPLDFVPPRRLNLADEAEDAYYQSMGVNRPWSELKAIGVPQCVVDDTDDFDLRRRREDFTDPLDYHLNLLRLKLAARLMWFDGREDMNVEDWQLAGYVIDRIHKPTREAFREGAAEARQKAMSRQETDRALARGSAGDYALKAAHLADKLYDKVGDKEVTGGQLKRWASRNPALDDAIGLLVSSGRWAKRRTDTAREGWRYRRP